MTQYSLPVAAVLAMFLSQPTPIQQKPTSFLRERMMSGQPTLVAYAGGAAEQLENSLSAVQQAIQVGAQAIQVDVQATQDKVIICHKGETLERTTGQQEQVSQISYEQIDRFQQTVETEYGEQYQQQQPQEGEEQQQEKPARFEQVAQEISQSDAILFVNVQIPQQQFAQPQEGQNQEEQQQQQDAEKKLKVQLINKALSQIREQGLESRTVVQIERQYWSKIREVYPLINLMEPLSESYQRYEAFAQGEFQQQQDQPEYQQQQNQPDVYQAVYNFQTLQQAPEQVREQIIIERQIQEETPFGEAVEEITLEQWAQQQQQQRPVVQIMNRTYEKEARIPVAYGVVNTPEDLQQAYELGANIIFTEKIAELSIEQQTSQQVQVQAQQYQFRA